jgi:RNA polymerase sigma factor (sigma-70 family)
MAGNDDFRLDLYRDYLRALAEESIGQRSSESLGATRVVEQVLQEAHDAPDQLRGKTEQELAAWLRTILNKTIAEVLHVSGLPPEGGAGDTAKPTGKPAADLAEMHEALPPGKLASHNEQLLQLAAALERLPADQRAVVEMKHLHGLSMTDICERTGRSKHAVVGLLFHGLTTLRKVMDERRKDGSPDGF